MTRIILKRLHLTEGGRSIGDNNLKINGDVILILRGTKAISTQNMVR